MSNIIAIQETKIDRNIFTSELFPDNFNYDVYRNDRTLNGGGVMTIPVFYHGYHLYLSTLIFILLCVSLWLYFGGTLDGLTSFFWSLSASNLFAICIELLFSKNESEKFIASQVSILSP
jgi:hypothetical protein